MREERLRQTDCLSVLPVLGGECLCRQNPVVVCPVPVQTLRRTFDCVVEVSSEYQRTLGEASLPGRGECDVCGRCCGVCRCTFQKGLWLCVSMPVVYVLYVLAARAVWRCRALERI